MPRIILKPGSPEYADESDTTLQESPCDMPGCTLDGLHKAPKHRDLDEYYNFCVDHIREYNKAWNFFEGMAAKEVRDHMENSYYGDRPTWKNSSDHQEREEKIREQIHRKYHGYTDEKYDKKREGNRNNIHIPKNSPEYEALSLMDLSPPINLEDIKARYKSLAKKYHPDLNQGCHASEERLKQINMAYTILKVAYESFEKLKTK